MIGLQVPVAGWLARRRVVRAPLAGNELISSETVAVVELGAVRRHGRLHGR
ncbi:MAG: hypothetical protein M5U01_19245 [Ardenticatenaceae bacterium]|nr:hypothetical protein [Ardenticatenaceae bacterium]